MSIKPHLDAKVRLLKTINRLQQAKDCISNQQVVFRELMDHLDKNLPSKMSQEDAKRIMEFHQVGATEFEDGLLHETNTLLVKARCLLKNISHYTEKSFEDCKAFIALMDKLLEELALAKNKLLRDSNTLGKYAKHRFKAKLALRGIKRHLMSPPSKGEEF